MKLPPVEGVPAGAWPRCPWCDRKLRPHTRDTEENRAVPGGTQRVVTRRVFAFWNAYDGLWCRLGCAQSFATASYRGGFRRKQ